MLQGLSYLGGFAALITSLVGVVGYRRTLSSLRVQAETNRVAAVAAEVAAGNERRESEQKMTSSVLAMVDEQMARLRAQLKDVEETSRMQREEIHLERTHSRDCDDRLVKANARIDEQDRTISDLRVQVANLHLAITTAQIPFGHVPATQFDPNSPPMTTSVSGVVTLTPQ